MTRKTRKPTKIYWQRLNHPYWYCKLVYVYHDGMVEEISDLFYTEAMLEKRANRGDYLPKFWKPATAAQEHIAIVGSRFKDYSQAQRDIDPRDKGEAIAIARLLAQGIPTIPGKNRRDKKWVDAVAWGCVDIEVKYSAMPKEWQWSFRSTINKATSTPDVIMLIGIDRQSHKTYYYLFDAMHSYFSMQMVVDELPFTMITLQN